MKTVKELQEIWDNISPFSGGFLLASEDHPLSFHIGYYGDRQKCFVVLNTGKIEKIVSSKAISVNCVELEDQTIALRFILNYPSLDELFVKLCWDLMDSSREAVSPVATVVERYGMWLKLLQQIGNGLLPVNIQKGLIGELLFLQEQILEKGETIAINSWVGPEGNDQDFNFDSTWVEVKTSIISGTTVVISSLQQLDRTEEGRLVVYFLDKTMSSASNTISLDEAIEHNNSIISDEKNRQRFLMKLCKCGYQEKNATEYNSIRFKLAEKRMYRVAESFPRLIPSTVPVPVVEANYNISLPAIEAFRLKE